MLVAVVAFSGTPVGAQSFHETAGVRLIRVDLGVTDRDGRPVLGLKSSEIQLRVDGQPLPVESLDAIEPEAMPAPLRAAIPGTPRVVASPAPPAAPEP